MAITQCSECGGKVSNRLDSCPHCGSPMEPGLVYVEPQQSQISQQVSPVAGGAIPSGNVTQAARDKSDKTFIDDLQGREVDDIVSRLLEEGITSEQELRRRIDSLEALVSKAGIGSWISMIIGAVIFIPVLGDQPWSVYDSPGVYQGMDAGSAIFLFFSGLLIGIPVKNMVVASSKSKKLKEAERIYLATHIT